MCKNHDLKKVKTPILTVFLSRKNNTYTAIKFLCSLRVGKLIISLEEVIEKNRPTASSTGTEDERATRGLKE